eukprot:14397665-Ditylum_brightwellii.AAC.1
MGDYNLCEIMCRRLCELDPDNLTSKNKLVTALLYNCKDADAEMLSRKCLEARKASLGETHPETLTSMNHL